jgi:hypothetical protein
MAFLLVATLFQRAHACFKLTESLIKTSMPLRLRRKKQMKGNMLTATAYPPPPPPQSSPKKDSHKLLVIALLLVIIIVSAGVLFYLATRPSSTGTPTPTPTPTGTATPTPTGSTPSPTATPSGTNPIANWRAGSWATYILKTYESGEVAAEGTMKYAIDEGTYNGTACWLMSYEMNMTQTSGAMKTLMTYWISKSTLEGIHVKTQIYVDDVLMTNHEEDLTPGETGDMPEPIDMDTVTSYETVTVPAGTFNCGKITVTTTISGTTSTTSSWANSGIPIMGLVKLESASGGVVTSTTELVSYHS